MATGSITWYGDYGTTGAGSSGKITSLTSYSGALPANATITSITYTLDMSAQWSTTSLYWQILWLHAVNANSGTAISGAGIGTIGGTTAVVSEQAANQPSGGATHTFSGSLDLKNSSVFQSTTIYCNTKANITGSPSSYMKTISVTVNYTTQDPPSTPTLSISNSTPYFEDSINLTWTDSTVSGNNITKYTVQYSAYSDFSSGVVSTDITTKVSGKVITYWNNATKPSTYGDKWYYRVKAYGDANPSESGWSNVVSCEPTVKLVKHPTSVTLSSSSVTTGGQTTLSWSGEQGFINNPVLGFNIYRSTDINSIGQAVVTGISSSTHSYTFTVPSSAGTYYYRVACDNEGDVENFNKDNPYAALTVTAAKAVSVPSAVRINGKLADDSVYSSSTFNLSWTASSLTNITGTITYHIEITQYTSGSPNTWSLTTTGTSYNIGEHSGDPSPSIFRDYYAEYYLYATVVESGVTYTSQNTSSYFYKYIDESISAPSNVKLNGETPSISFLTPTVVNSFTLTWDASVRHNITGDITYHIVVNGQEKGTTTDPTRTFTISDISSYTAATGFYVYATCAGYTSNYQLYAFKYENITVTKPGTPGVTQNNDNTISVTFTGSTGSGGTGSVTYDILIYNATTLAAQIGVEQSGTVVVPRSGTGYSIPYDTNLTYVIRAKYSGVTSDSDSSTFVFHTPTITMGNVSSSFADGVITISWQNATQSYSSGTITYYMKIGSGNYFTVTGNSYTVPNPSQYTSDTTVTMYAKDSYATSTTKTTTIRFTATIKCYNGTAWVDCTVSYYDGTQWVPCLVKYYNGSGWV